MSRTVWRVNFEALEKLRKSKGLGQKIFSEVAGCTEGFVTQVKNGEKNFGIGKIKKLSEYFGVSVDDLTISESTVGLVNAKRIPILASIPAGNPRDIHDTSDVLGWTHDENAPDGCYALRVTGDCMSPKINDGDLVICKFVEDPPYGKVAVLRNEYSEFTLKRLKRRDDGVVELFCDNEDQVKYPPKSTNGWTAVGVALWAVPPKRSL